MAGKISLEDVDHIGTSDVRIEQIWVNYLCVKNLSFEGSDYSAPDVETKRGVNFNAATGKLEFNDTVSTAITFDSTVTASGLITANGGLTLGANMTTGSNWIRGSGANVGMKFTGAAVEFSSTLTIAGQIYANKVGNWSIQTASGGDIQVGGYLEVLEGISVGGAIEAQGNIRTLGGKFKVAGDEGLNTTVDFTTYAGVLTFAGGILIGKS